MPPKKAGRQRKQSPNEISDVVHLVKILEQSEGAMSEYQIAEEHIARGNYDFGNGEPQKMVSLRLSDYRAMRGLPEGEKVKCLVKRIGPSLWMHKHGAPPNWDLLRKQIEHMQSRDSFKDLCDSMTELFNFVRVWMANNRGHKTYDAAEKFKAGLLKGLRAAGTGMLEQQHFVTDSPNEHKRLSVVFIGDNGVGKSNLINTKLMMHSPYVPRGKTGYYWTSPELTDAQRKRCLNLAIDTINTELACLGVTPKEQVDLFIDACGGIPLADPGRRLFNESDKEMLDLADQVEAQFLRRLDHNVPEDNSLYWDNPYLLPSGLSATSSTTSYSAEIIYGPLPAVITMFKSPEELAEEVLIQRKYPNDFKAAMELCELRRFSLVVGNGENLTLDRMYVSRMLMSQQKDRIHSIATKKKVIFFPVHSLKDGGSYIDTPGCNDANPIVKANLPKICKDANKIVLVMQRNVEHNEAAQNLLRDCGIFDRMVRDPLNYDVHFLENSEKFTETRCVSEAQLRAFHNRHPIQVCQEEARFFFNDEMAKARARAVAANQPAYDRHGELHILRIFPILSAATALYRVKHKKEWTAEEEERILQNMELNGGLELLGSMHKLFYGYQHQVLADLVEQLDPSDLAPALKTKCAPLVRQLHEQHHILAALALEGKASVFIGRSMMRSKHQGIFPKVADMNDNVCILDCKKSERKTVGGQAINCDNCKVWFHPKCIGMDQRAFAEFNDNGLLFYCQSEPCQAMAKTLGPQTKRKAPQSRSAKRIRK